MEDAFDNALDDFEDLLHDGYKARELFGDTTWEKAEKLYRHDTAWKRAPRDEAKRIFDKFIAKVSRREAEKAKKRQAGSSDKGARADKRAKRDVIEYDY
jgi:hypothetical protein